MAGIPTIAEHELPWLTVDQMVEADRLAIEEFGIELLQMMEHAGASLAELTMRLAPSGPITVLAGAGNNGGGGLCAARHLINRGRSVEVVLAGGSLGEAPAHHLRTLGEMGVEPRPDPGYSTIVVDALVGYGLDGPLRGRAAELARWASMNHFVVSLDFPSGRGFPGGVESHATLTLALPKEGLRDLRPLFVADLGLPSALWRRMGLDVGPIFAEGRIVRVEG
jgi:NAD(P)H-hydrate epimerase